MTYKTILVHLTDEAQAPALMRLARPLAERHAAHLIGLVAIPLLEAPARSQAATDALLLQYRGAIRAEAARIEALFKTPVALETIATEWRLVDTGLEGVTDVVARQGRIADLIITSQDNPDWQSSGPMRDTAGVIATTSGRPVLVVPFGNTATALGERVLVAWNGSREAARAVFDALPILKQARSVVVLAVQTLAERESTDVGGYSEGRELCASLSRHGVSCELKLVTPENNDVGETLTSAVEANASDLLVMGGYGRSRLSEMLFGGATRSVLREMHIPVLLSH